MTSSDNTYRRRRRGLWTTIRNPLTVRAIILMAWVVYRLLRGLIEIFGSYG